MLMIEVNISKIVFSIPSDFLSYDQLLKVDDRVLRLDVLVSDQFLTSALGSMKTPSHMRIFCNNLAYCLLFGIVEIGVALLDVELLSFLLIWR